MKIVSEGTGYSIDEILADVKNMKSTSGPDPLEDLFKNDEEAVFTEEESEASVFAEIETETQTAEEAPVITQEAPGSGTSLQEAPSASEEEETDETAQAEEEGESESTAAEAAADDEEDDDVKVYDGTDDEGFSFKERYEDKKLERERKYRTRVFSKKSSEAEASDDKTRVSTDTPEVSESEKKLEKEFKEKRQEKINQFRLFTENLGEEDYDDEDEAVSVTETVKTKKGENIFEAIENTSKPKKENSKRREKRKKRDSKVYDKIDVGRVRLRLEEDARSIKIRLIVTLVTAVIFLVLGAAKTLYLGGKLDFVKVLMDNPLAVYAAELVLGIPALILALKALLSRIRESEKPTLCSEAVSVTVLFFNTVHSLVLVLMKPEIDNGVMLLSTASCFIVLLETFSEKKQNVMIKRNLEAIIRNDTIMGVFSLESESEKLASGISKAKEPMVLCAGEVEIPNSFLDSSFTKDKENAFFNIAIPASVILSAVCGVIAYMSYGSITAFSGAALSALLVSSPAFIAPVLVMLIARTNEGLNRTGCEILGYEDVENIDDTDAIVLDTADIFTGNIKHFHLISRNVRIDTLHAFEIACSVLYSSGGVLKGEIAEFMKEQKLVLPEVEDIKYEEKLGLSCWVENKCVLLGTEKMMREHNIDIPPEYSGVKYEKEGSKVFYLAVDTHATAMFCADYFIGRQVRKQLVDLYSTGVILMLMTTDPHIDEQFVANTLGVSDSSIKTVSPVGASQIRESIGKTTKQKRTGLIFRKSVVGLLRVINSAFRLYDVQSLAILIQIISMVFAVVVSGVLSAAGTGYLPGVIFIIAYHLIWMALGYFVTNKNKK